MSKVDEIGREGNVPEKNQLFNLSYVGNFRIKNHETLQLFHSRTKTSELVTSQALLNQYSGVSVATRPLFAEQMFASDRAPVWIPFKQSAKIFNVGKRRVDRLPEILSLPAKGRRTTEVDTEPNTFVEITSNVLSYMFCRSFDISFDWWIFLRSASTNNFSTPNEEISTNVANSFGLFLLLY